MRLCGSAVRTGIVLGVAVVGSVLATLQAGARSSYAYCAVSRGFEIVYEDCSFATFEACLAEIRGLGGSCRPNSYYVPPPPERRYPDRSRQRLPR